MSELLIPDTKPPQLSEYARDVVIQKISEKGLINTSLSAREAFSSKYQKLSDYIDILGIEMSFKSKDLHWHKDAIRIGAGLAWYAYYETGFFQNIDTHFDSAETLAKRDGVPETYLSSLVCDQKLTSLINVSIQKGPEMALQRSDIRQVLDIGAGCVRFYLQQAVIAA